MNNRPRTVSMTDPLFDAIVTLGRAHGRNGAEEIRVAVDNWLKIHGVDLGDAAFTDTPQSRRTAPRNLSQDEGSTMQLRTRKIAPTDTRGTRIRVTDQTGRTLLVAYDFGARDPHEAGARLALTEWLGAETAETATVEPIKETTTGRIFTVTEVQA